MDALEKEDFEALKSLLKDRKEKINDAFSFDETIDCSEERKLQTPLTLACQKANLEIVKALVEVGGADVNRKDKKTIRPLYQACLSGNQDLVEYLVSKGADLNKPGWNKFTSVFAAVERDNLILLKYLKENGADLSVQCSRGGLMRHCAYKHLSMGCLDYLMEEVDLNTVNQQFQQNVIYEVC